MIFFLPGWQLQATQQCSGLQFLQSAPHALRPGCRSQTVFYGKSRPFRGAGSFQDFLPGVVLKDCQAQERQERSMDPMNFAGPK